MTARISRARRPEQQSFVLALKPDLYDPASAQCKVN
jgi:hypothetical protein